MLRKHVKLRAAVKTRGFNDVARQGGHEVAQQIDRQRQAKARVGKPYAEIGLSDADGVVQLKERNEGELQRHASKPTTAASSSVRPGNSIQASA